MLQVALNFFNLFISPEVIMKKYLFLILSFTFLSLIFDFDIQAMKRRRASTKRKQPTHQRQAPSVLQEPQKTGPSSFTHKRTAELTPEDLRGKRKEKRRKREEETNNLNCGLINGQSICYLNSIVQCLSNLALFRETLLQNKDSYQNRPLIFNFIKLIEDLRRSAGPIKNQAFTNAARNLIKQQTENSQWLFQDANEFLGLFWSKLEPEELFPFNMSRNQEIKCTHCNEKSKETFKELASITTALNHLTLQQILASYFSSSRANDYVCNSCKHKNTSTITNKISQYPNELIITLKRFTYDHQQQTVHKKLDPIQFPTTLDLKSYAITQLQQTSTNSLYELVGMVCYDGSHYISYAKDFETGKWHLYNDETVREVTDRKIQQITVSGIAKNNFTPYLLFYELKEVEAMQPAAEPECDEERGDSDDEEADPLNLFDKKAQISNQASKRRKTKEMLSSDEEEFDIELLEQAQKNISPSPDNHVPTIHYNPEDYERLIRGDTKLVGAKLEGATFPDKVNLSGVDLTNANLRGVKLRGAILIGTILEGADLTDAYLTEAKLIKTNLKNAILVNTDLSGATLDNAVLINTRIVHSKFINAKLNNLAIRTKYIIKDTNFYNATFNNVNFYKCNLWDINMQWIKTNKLTFNATMLDNIEFNNAHLLYLGIFNNFRLGNRLNFENATIEKSCILGRNALSSAPWFVKILHKTVQFPEYLAEKLCSITMIDNDSSQSFSRLCTIGSIIFQSIFYNTQIIDTYLCNLLFANCTGLDDICDERHTIFDNIFIRNNNKEHHHFLDTLRDVSHFRHHSSKQLQSNGAKVNGKIDKQFKRFWDATPDPEQDLIEMLARTFFTTATAEAGRAGIAALAGCIL